LSSRRRERELYEKKREIKRKTKNIRKNKYKNETKLFGNQ
jgi:hypothetical protein